jgi:DNA ligase (NAD+)
LARLIFALGIRYVGERLAEILAEHFPSLEALSNATYEELIKIPEIGPRIAQSIVDFFRNEENRKLIQELKELGVKTEAEKPKEGPLSGKTFVFTGTLSRSRGRSAEARGIFGRSGGLKRLPKSGLRSGGRGSRGETAQSSGAWDHDPH